MSIASRHWEVFSLAQKDTLYAPINAHLTTRSTARDTRASRGFCTRRTFFIDKGEFCRRGEEEDNARRSARYLVGRRHRAAGCAARSVRKKALIRGLRNKQSATCAKSGGNLLFRVEHHKQLSARRHHLCLSIPRAFIGNTEALIVRYDLDKSSVPLFVTLSCSCLDAF